MINRHLIALDLDGTLLTDERTISPFTKKVIRKAREEGHIVMIATGRPFRSSEMYYNELQLDTPIVNFNGAFIHHPQDRSFGFYHSPVDIKIVKDIVEALDSFTFHNIIAEVMDDLYFHCHDKKLNEIFQVGNPNVTTGDLRKFLQHPPTSMLVHTTEDELAKIRQHLSSLHAEVIMQRSWSAPWFVIEIIKSGVSKAVGIKRACEYLQIPKDRVIAFGDEDNDLEMIEYAGQGIAMGNSIDALKNIANKVTLTNQEDGVAVYLNDALNLNVL